MINTQQINLINYMAVCINEFASRVNLKGMNANKSMETLLQHIEQYFDYGYQKHIIDLLKKLLQKGLKSTY